MDEDGGERSHLEILVVDDHPLIRAGMKACLAARPNWHVCAEAGDGEAAVRMAHEHRPDVVVLDFALPLRNGLEVIRELRQAYPRMGLVVFSMHSDNRLIMDCLKAGALGWVSKNDDDEILLTAIASVAAGGTYIGYVGGQKTSEATKRPPFLTPRELEIVTLVSEGETNRRIAARLNVSAKTVDTHRMSAMKKFDVHTVAELVRRAIKEKMILP